MPLRDALVQTQALMEGVVKIATELNAAGLYNKTRNSSETWSGIILHGARWHPRVDHGWYPPTSTRLDCRNPEHAARKLTRPYEWLRREGISNLITMQALSRPRQPRRVLTPGQGEEAPPGGLGCKKVGPAEGLARYYAACYVEIPWKERYQALGMLKNWFEGHTAEWVANERARAGLTLTAPESEANDTTSPGIPREEPGPREQEPQPQLQAAPPTMDIYHECAAEGCDTLVCNGGEQQHMQSPYCSDACWYEHAKDVVRNPTTVCCAAPL